MSEQELEFNIIEELEKEGKLRGDEKFYYYKLLDGNEVVIRKRITFGEMQNIDNEMTKNRNVDSKGNVTASLEGYENFLRKKLLTYAGKIIKPDGKDMPMTREILDSLDAEEIIEVNGVLDCHYNNLKKKQSKISGK